MYPVAMDVVTVLLVLTAVMAPVAVDTVVVLVVATLVVMVAILKRFVQLAPQGFL